MTRHAPTARLIIDRGIVAGGFARCGCGYRGPDRTDDDYYQRTRDDIAAHTAATRTTARGN